MPARPRHGRRITIPHGRPCPTGKVRFRDRREAISALHSCVSLRRQAEVNGHSTRRAETHTYRCNTCEGWHLTSTPKRTTPTINTNAKLATQTTAS